MLKERISVGPCLPRYFLLSLEMVLLSMKFIAMLVLEIGYFFTPWAPAIGAVCFLQGIIYRLSSKVLYAEYMFGGLIGASFTGILLLS